jgi:hypothetical protein
LYGKRSIRRKIQIARDIDPGVKDKIQDCDLAHRTSELLKLARI